MRNKIAFRAALALMVLAAVVVVLGAGCRRSGPAPTGTTGPATHQPVAAAKVVNVTCPIMGTKIDPAKVPDSLIREYKGQKVGFCCGACPPAWDKLTDAEKDAKLQAALPKP